MVTYTNLVTTSLLMLMYIKSNDIGIFILYFPLFLITATILITIKNIIVFVKGHKR